MSKLVDIQKGYIEIVKRYFGHFYNESKRVGVRAGDIAENILSQPHFAKLIEDSIEDTFLLEIEEYWDKNYKDLIVEINKLSGLRLYFSGDLSPSDYGVVSRMGLYADTIILPDPVLRSRMTIQIARPHLKYFYLLKHSIKVLDYEHIVLANVPQPIVIFFPSNKILEEEERRKQIYPIVYNETAGFLNSNLSIQQSDFGEWVSYFSRLRNLEELEKVTTNKDAFLFDSDNQDRGFASQIRSLIKMNATQMSDEVNKEFSGLKIIPYSIMGRIAQAKWHLTKSGMLGAFPFQDAYVSWHYLKWNMRNEKKFQDKSQIAIPSFLQESNFSFLSKVPLDVLIKLREDGVLQDLRNTINREVNLELTDATKEEALKQIQYNLKNEFIKHQSEVRKMDEDFRKSFKLDAASIIGSVGLGILGVASNPLFAIPATVLGGSNLWDIAGKYNENESKKMTLRSHSGDFSQMKILSSGLSILSNARS